MGGYGATLPQAVWPSGPPMSAPLAAPGAAALSQVASGALAATTYFVRCSFLSGAGESIAPSSAESSLAVLINNVLVVTQPPIPQGANGAPQSVSQWRVYVSTTTGTETLQVTLPISTTSWQEPNTGLVAGAAMPAVNTGVAQGRTFPIGQVPPQNGAPPCSGIGLDQSQITGNNL